MTVPAEILAPDGPPGRLRLGRCFADTLRFVFRNAIPLLLAGVLSNLLHHGSYYLLAGPVEVGFYLMALGALRERRPVVFLDFFRGLDRRVLSYLLAYFLFLCAILPLYALCIVPSLPVWTILLYVLPLMADRRLGVWAAVRESWRLTRGGGLLAHGVFAVLGAAIFYHQARLIAEYSRVTELGRRLDLGYESAIGYYVIEAVVWPIYYVLVATAYHQVADHRLEPAGG